MARCSAGIILPRRAIPGRHRIVAAVPVPKDRSDIVLADFTLPAAGIGGLSEAELRNALQRLVARTPGGAALLAAMGTATGLRQLSQMIGDARLHSTADRLGLDTTSVEGLWAAYASVWMSELVATGFGTGIDKDQELARIAGQAAALYELMAPGTMRRIGQSENFAALSRFATEAARAYRDGRLRLTPDGWAQGWTEVFPELTEDERRLAELPGFTAEQQRAFILADPVLNDGLPTHTGHAPEGDPVGNVISTPTPSGALPNVLETRRGRDFVTPAGNIIPQHGYDESGREYIEGRKGHTGEQIDDLIANPDRARSGYVQAKGRRKGEKIRLLTGQDGYWVKLDDMGHVIAASNRHLPLKHKENDHEEIIGPLEE